MEIIYDTDEPDNNIWSWTPHNDYQVVSVPGSTLIEDKDKPKLKLRFKPKTIKKRKVCR